MALPPSLPHTTPGFVEVVPNNIALPQQAPKPLDIVEPEKRVTIRPYSESDFFQVAKIYQISFAEPPWNEYMKCAVCGAKYSTTEVSQLAHSFACKKCENALLLRAFWGHDEIRQDLDFSFSQPFPVVLVAENGCGLMGMIWGCLMPLDQFIFLKDHVSMEAHYLDDIAVRQDKRMGGVGTMLGQRYLDEVKKMGISEVVLRTDERNTASMALFKKLGFLPLMVEGNLLRDPDHFHRIYLKLVF